MLPKPKDFFEDPQWPSIDEVKPINFLKSIDEKVFELPKSDSPQIQSVNDQTNPNINSTTAQASFEDDSLNIKYFAITFTLNAPRPIKHEEVNLQFYDQSFSDMIDDPEVQEMHKNYLKDSIKLQDFNFTEQFGFVNSNEQIQSRKHQVNQQVESVLDQIKLEESILDQNEESKQTETIYLAQRSKYKILNKYQKKFLVKQTEYKSVAEVARLFNVSVNNLCRWKKNCQRKVGAGRKVTDSEMERKLLVWIDGKEKTLDGFTRLNRRQIQSKARELASNTQFKASKGWFERFSKRHKNLFGFLNESRSSNSNHEKSLNSSYLENSLSLQNSLSFRKSSCLKFGSNFSKQSSLLEFSKNSNK